MNEIKIQNKIYNTPSTWNELTFEQLSLICSLINKKLRKIDFHLITLFKFLNIKHQIFNKISDIDMAFLYDTTKFITDKVELTTNLLPFFRINLFKKFYGPSNMLKNITFIEFAKADTYYLSWNNTKDDKYLNKMIASLYRPKKLFIFIRKLLYMYDGDPRQEYKDFFITKNEKYISKLNINKRTMIMLFYQGCRNHIIEKFPHVFKSGNESNKNNFGWAQLILELAGTKFGNDTQTSNTLLYTILMHLEIAGIQNEEYKRNLKQRMSKNKKR